MPPAFLSSSPPSGDQTQGFTHTLGKHSITDLHLHPENPEYSRGSEPCRQTQKTSTMWFALDRRYRQGTMTNREEILLEWGQGRLPQWEGSEEN